jgi:hypothetical protein
MMTRGERVFSCLTLIVGVLSMIAAWLVVPEFRSLLSSSKRTEPTANGEGQVLAELPSSGPAHGIVHNDFLVQASKCTVHDLTKKTTCTFMITNLSDGQRWAGVDCKYVIGSTLVDKRGHNCVPVHCQLASDIEHRLSVEAPLESRVPYTLRLTFEGAYVTGTVPYISVAWIESPISWWPWPSSRTILKFRQVPVEVVN